MLISRKTDIILNNAKMQNKRPQSCDLLVFYTDI
ncbi:hypothetical protein VCSRO96_0267 [Vibrio cholerae]|nr:hypothetical protein VCSRO96_0267 [Vibrio cholerae]GHW92689.1 hypothetical protein VCSRO6_1583 [Vibrio cholerae]